VTVVIARIARKLTIFATGEYVSKK